MASWARYASKDVSTLTGPERDIIFMDITGQNSEELLETAAKPVDEQHKRLAAHITIVDTLARM